MLVNENPEEPLIALVGVFDGNQNIVAQFRTHLSPLDLDEINICRTIELDGVVPPQAGVLEIVSLKEDGVTGEGGIYAWVKNLTLKKADEWKRPASPLIAFPRTVAGANAVIPATSARTVMAKVYGKAMGVGKTECRITPPEVFENATTTGPGPSTISRVLAKIQPG